MRRDRDGGCERKRRFRVVGDEDDLMLRVDTQLIRAMDAGCADGVRGCGAWSSGELKDFDGAIAVADPEFAMVDDQHSVGRSEEHTSELQSRSDLVCRLLLEKKKK